LIAGCNGGVGQLQSSWHDSASQPRAGNMSNPYEAPKYEVHPFQPNLSGTPGGVVPSGMVQQVRVFGILNAVQGGLEVLMSLLFLFYAVFFPMMMSNPEFNQGGGEPPPKEFFWGMGIYFGVVGALTLIAAVSRIISGVMNWQFRSRGLTLFSIFLGIASMFSCYCAPTSIAMLVYGLILMFSTPVKQAFAMAETGMPPDQILHEFSPYGPNSGAMR
jgi:hypothetical protein